ncbi:hypothetical protein GCM10010524_28270 [Streptomyces mexicanus]
MSMAAEPGVTIVAVDPAYTSRWGARHWQKPLTSEKHKTSRHHAASVASAGAWGTRSGWGYLPGRSGTGGGRHRPRTTGVIVRGIGPSRPHRMPRGVREPALAFPDHAHDAPAPDAASRAGRAAGVRP